MSRKVTFLWRKIEGIVLRTSDYGEANKIVTLFSREIGKFGAVARGAKKPNSRLASVTQPFTHGFFICTVGSGLGTIHQGEIIDPFRSVKGDIFLTAYASYIVELTDKSTDEKRAYPSLFELLRLTLHYLDRGSDPDILKNIFEIKMLHVLGHQPQLAGCASCGKAEGDFSFSVREGGLLCERCAGRDPYAIKISPSTAKLLRLFSVIDLNRLGSINVKERTKKELNDCISAYYDEYTGLYLKTKKFLNQMEKFKP